MYGSEEQPYFSSHKSQPRKNQSMGILQSPPLLPYSLQQPPLLPYPAAHPYRSSSSRTNSCRIKDQPPPTTKKPTKIPRNEEKKSLIVPKGIYTYGNNKSVTKVSNSSGRHKAVDEDRVDNMIPGFSVLTISSPPPSSLPLPTFTLRRKPIRP